MFHISLNTKPKWVKQDQVRKNIGKQVIPLATHAFKQFQKYNTTQIIKYRFIWGIINKQSVPRIGVGKFWEENIKVIMENWLLKITREKMINFLAQFLFKNSRWIQGILFFFNFIDIFVDVVMSCNRPNINFKLK
jgi:hypothetical protein